jgi:hypothetical protein
MLQHRQSFRILLILSLCWLFGKPSKECYFGIPNNIVQAQTLAFNQKQINTK